jgi:glycosyltransferase involved in cell wall biosynthesis
MAKNERSRPSLLVFGDDWARHPSSVQHLVKRLRPDYRILWVNSIGTRQVKANSITVRRALEKVNNWRQGLKQVSEAMWVIDLPMLPGTGRPLIRNINRCLVTSRLRSMLARLGMERPTVLTTLPYMNWLIRDLPRAGLVYYCTDDYSHWPSADGPMLRQADRELAESADLILAASRLLHQRYEHTGRCHYFPHGVDFEHFASVQAAKRPMPSNGERKTSRIGFFGLIYEKLDFELLTAVAQAFPHARLDMIGPVATCPEAFAQLPNVHFAGAKPYEELPRHLADLDVLLLPYVNDEMIRQSGPLKLRECLASGKPTVSIDVPDVRAYVPHVRIGTDISEFVVQVGAALAERHDLERVRGRQDAVRQDGWDERARRLRNHLQDRPAMSRLSKPAKVRRGPARILHLRTVAGKGGGPEKTLLNSPRFLTGSYDVRLAYIRPQGDPEYDMPAKARAMNVDLVDIPEVGPLDPRTLVRLAREVEAFRPDLLHAHDYKTNVLGLALGPMFGIPVITTVHGYVTRGGRLEAYYLLDRWALRRMEHVVAVSEDLYQHLVDDLRLPRSKCSLIENGIDTQQYCRRVPAAEAKQRLGLDPQRLVLGAVGRLSREKGFDLLLRAFHDLLRTGADAELLLAGDGAERASLAALAAELGIADRVHLLGYRADTMALYEAMDLFVLSSLREGLPNVLLEAMALEVPAVATRICGVPRLVEDGINGILIDPNSVESLTEAFRRLADDPATRTQLGRAGRATVETRFSFARRMAKIKALYDTLLDRTDTVVAAGAGPASTRGS